ncbi:uncharacterized protein LOC106457212 isoform X1 [Limulus polyphemus]|uniref:Uncharacterized protein LOC106457212 isoform X1 n=1 Tax=Limulus polyphemus TaxID=6850 RepID=A0ABM1S549_LIMPO|nr:uncharacterized protein LOC106457212 isoform X1 [Limulus polyphemus]
MYRVIGKDTKVTIMLDIVLLFLLCFNLSRSDGETTVTEFLSNSSYSTQLPRSTGKYLSTLTRTVETTTKQSVFLPNNLNITTKEQELSPFLSTVKQETTTLTPVSSSNYFDSSPKREETPIHTPSSTSSYLVTFTTGMATDTHPQGSQSKEVGTSIPRRETTSESSTFPLRDSDISSTGQESTTHPPGSSFEQLGTSITKKETTNEFQTSPINTFDIASTGQETTTHLPGSSSEQLGTAITKKETTNESQTSPVNNFDIASTGQETTIHLSGSSFEYLGTSITKKETTIESQTSPVNDIDISSTGQEAVTHASTSSFKDYNITTIGQRTVSFQITSNISLGTNIYNRSYTFAEVTPNSESSTELSSLLFNSTSDFAHNTEKLPSIIPTSTAENTTFNLSFPHDIRDSTITPPPIKIEYARTLVLLFQGNCTHQGVLSNQFRKAFAQALNNSNNNDQSSVIVNEIRCTTFLNVNVTVTTNNKEELETFVDNLVGINLKINSTSLETEIESYFLHPVSDDEASITNNKSDTSIAELAREELIFFIAVGASFGAVLIIVLLICCVKCCCRKPPKPSEFQTNTPHVTLRLEDYSLTRIPRPRTIYSDYYRGSVQEDNTPETTFPEPQSQSNGKNMEQSFNTSVIPLEEAEKLDESYSQHNTFPIQISTPSELKTFAKKGDMDKTKLLDDSNFKRKSKEKLAESLKDNRNGMRGIDNPIFIHQV